MGVIYVSVLVPWRRYAICLPNATQSESSKSIQPCLNPQSITTCNLKHPRIV